MGCPPQKLYGVSYVYTNCVQSALWAYCGSKGSVINAG